ncbi:MAG: Gmad2 immunoglobulin-like domain-containing protein [Chloroflexi bacterium]|nr:Gmad2 immunoglobulin-like domain-containing protein [Chloroflexota bacterium]
MTLRYRRLIWMSVAAGALVLSACGGDGDVDDATPSPAPSGAITIDAPENDAQVSVPFEVSGEANVFEAALVLQALDPGGAVLCEQQVQATSGTGTPGTWSATLAFPPPASEREVTLRAFSRSAKDGSEENVVTRPVRVRPDLPAIVVEAPRCGVTTIAQSVVTASGTASVFEGSLQVELRDATGTVVATKTVQTVGAPERGDWATAFDVGPLPAGQYEVAAYSISAKDGSVENEFAVPFFKAQ